MRYKKEHKDIVRQRIIDSAIRRYQSEGIESVGIANLMADLGLTHGGFYGHFADKEALVAHACQTAFLRLIQHWKALCDAAPPGSKLHAIVHDYLSTANRDGPDSACFAAALGGEIARRDHVSRKAFSEGIQQLLEVLGDACRQDGSAHRPEAMLATMTGAMMLARAQADRNLSDALLESTRSQLCPAQ